MTNHFLTGNQFPRGIAAYTGLTFGAKKTLKGKVDKESPEKKSEPVKPEAPKYDPKVFLSQLVGVMRFVKPETTSPEWEKRVSELAGAKGQKDIPDYLKLKLSLITRQPALASERLSKMSTLLDSLLKTKVANREELLRSLQLMATAPVAEDAWKKAFDTIQTKIDAQEAFPYEVLAGLPLQSGSSDTSGWLSERDSLFCENASLKPMIPTYLKHYIQLADAGVPESRLKPLESFLETANSAKWNPATLIAFKLFAGMPVAESKWKEALPQVQEALSGKGKFPFTLLFQSDIKKSATNLQNWFAQLDTLLEAIPQEEVAGRYLEQYFNRPNLELSDARRQAMAELFKKINLEDFEADKTTIREFKLYASMPISDEAWKSMHQAVSNAWWDENWYDMGTNLKTVLDLTAQKKDLSAAEQAWVQAAGEHLKTFKGEAEPFLAMKISLHQNPEGGLEQISDKRKKKFQELLTLLYQKNLEVKAHTEASLKLFATLPVDDESWMDLWEGVQAQVEAGQTLDLDEILATVALENEPQDLPLTWLTPAAQLLKSRKHKQAPLLLEQVKLLQASQAQATYRHNAIQALLKTVGETEYSLSETDTEALDLLIKAPGTDTTWTKAVKELTETLGNTASLDLAKALRVVSRDVQPGRSESEGNWYESMLKVVKAAKDPFHPLLLFRDDYSSLNDAISPDRVNKLSNLAVALLDAEQPLSAEQAKNLGILAQMPVSDAEWSKDFDELWSQVTLEGAKPGIQEILVRRCADIIDGDPKKTEEKWLSTAVKQLEKSDKQAGLLLNMKLSAGPADGKIEPERIKPFQKFLTSLLLQQVSLGEEATQALEVFARLPMSQDQWLSKLAEVEAKPKKAAELLSDQVKAHAVNLLDAPSRSASDTEWLSAFRKSLKNSENPETQYLRLKGDLLASYKNSAIVTEYRKSLVQKMLTDAMKKGISWSSVNADMFWKFVEIPVADAEWEEEYYKPATQKIGDKGFNILDPLAKAFMKEYLAYKGSSDGWINDTYHLLRETQYNDAVLKLQKLRPYAALLAAKTPSEAVNASKSSGYSYESSGYNSYDSYDSKGYSSSKSAMSAMSVASAFGTPSANGSASSGVMADITSLLSNTFGALLLQTYQGNEKAFVDLMPHLLQSDQASTALELMNTYMQRIDRQMMGQKNHPNAAEIMLLLNNTEAQKGHYVVDSITEALSALDVFVNKGASVTGQTVMNWAKIGFLAHAFRFWKLDSQGGKDSLFGKFGFKPMAKRSTDEKYHGGYTITKANNKALTLKDGTLIEFRRGYLLVSHPGQGTLVIRNSSYVFGRDKMPHVAYYSETAMTEADLTTLDPANDYRFKNILTSNLYVSSQFPATLKFLLGELMALKSDYRKWKFDSEAFNEAGQFVGDRTAGMKQIVSMLEEALAQHQLGLTDKPLPSLVMTSPNMPVYEPFSYKDSKGVKKKQYEITEARLQEIKDSANGQWSAAKYPNSEWLKFVQAGVDNDAELILTDNK